MQQDTVLLVHYYYSKRISEIQLKSYVFAINKCKSNSRDGICIRKDIEYNLIFMRQKTRIYHRPSVNK